MSLSIPPALLASLRGTAGFDEAAFIETHRLAEKITSIRFNPHKYSLYNEHNSALPAALPIESEVPWCRYGHYLKERPSFTFDPLFHAGLYYVQEASSMFLWEVMQQTIGNNTQGLKVLDLCAAPGGKSTLLASYFWDGWVVSNEVIKVARQHFG